MEVNIVYAVFGLLVLSLGLAGLVTGRPSAGELPVQELARQAYTGVTDPQGLPGDVQAAWAAQLGQKRLHVAARGGEVNLSDLGGGGLPRHVPLAAAVSERYAVVHYRAAQRSGGAGAPGSATATSARS